MIQLLCQCIILNVAYAENKTPDILSKDFNYNSFRASVWFRVMDVLNITNTKILVMQVSDAIPSNHSSDLMSIEITNSGKQLLLTLKDSKQYLQIDDENNWLHLVITNEQLYGYFRITLESYKSSEHLTLEQSKQSILQVHFILGQSGVEFDNIQIDTLDNNLRFACQPGCQKCAQQNLFQCFECGNNRIIKMVNQSCECANFFGIAQKSCLSKQQLVSRYSTSNLVITDPLFLHYSNTSVCQDHQYMNTSYLNSNTVNILNILSQYIQNKNSLLDGKSFNVIFQQVDVEASINLINYGEEKWLQLNKSLIFHLNSLNNIFQLNLDQSTYKVKELNVINKLMKNLCISKDIDITILNMKIINQTLSEMIFFEDINFLKVINMTIVNCHVEAQKLFKSKRLLIIDFKLINCTVINSILFVSNGMSILNATIQNSYFINSNIIKGQLETLIMTNINISSIKLNSVNGLVHAWGSSNIQINIFEYRQISQYIGGIPIYLLGSHIILKHIMISNQNISNHPLEGMLQIQGQNVIITKITFEYIYGLYNNPMLIVKSSDQRFIFNLTDLYINSIFMQIGKINNLIQITSDIQGETFINNSIIDNLFLTDTIRIMDIISENIHISNTQINISNLHSGFQLLSKIVVVERLYLNTIDQQNDQFTPFIRIIANYIVMSELKLLSRLLIFGVMTPQDITMSNFQLINSYMYLPAFDLKNVVMSIDNFHQVFISNNIFVGNGSFYQIVIFMISQVYRTHIKDCEISQMYNFLCTQQIDEFSQINITNISYNLNFQFVTSFQLYFIQIFKGQHIIIIIRKVVFENIGIMKFCTLIQLNNITELIINGFSIQYLSLQRTILQIFSTYRSKSIHYQLDFRISFQNMTFRNIQLSSLATKSISLINIEAKQLIFQVDGLIFSHIIVDGQFNKILTISSIQEKIDIRNLNLFSCQCQDSCFSFNSQPANSDSIKIMNISISYSQFINNVASYLFMLQIQQKGKQQQMIVSNSIFLQNQFSLTPAPLVNQSINLIQSDIEYNTPPINQSQYKYQHSSGREYVSDIQIQMSTDNGQQYVLNRQILHLQYEVKIKNRASITNTFYIPTGQYFKDFILSNKFKLHEYQLIFMEIIQVHQMRVKYFRIDLPSHKYYHHY